MDRSKPLQRLEDYLFEADDLSLADLYRLNTNLSKHAWSRHLTEEQLAAGAWGKHVKRYESATRIALPQQTLEPATSITHALRSRSSTRSWQEKAISLAQLGAILRLGAGVIRIDKLNGQTAYYHGAPSGGARYPIEIYPVVINVEGVSAGVYHYNVPDHVLDVLCQAGDVQEYLLHSTVYPAFVENSSMVFFLTAVGERTMGKYTDRGYRYILLEAGHIAQNICLLASSLGLGSLCMAGFYEQDIEPLLWIDGSSEYLVYSVIVGYSADHQAGQG